MLRVNCGLSKKLSKDYNSTGYSVNIEAEIAAPVSDPDTVIEEVKQVFDLAEAALDAQIERSQSVSGVAQHDEEPKRVQPHASGTRRIPTENGNGKATSNGNGHTDEPATNKQVQFLLAIGKRMKLSTAALEKEVADILGLEVNLYDLTKKQAAVVLDAMTSTVGNGQGRG